MFGKKNNNKEEYLADPDVQLMLRFKAGDLPSFDVLLKKYFPRILNFIYRYTANETRAEDIAQEVFIRVYKSRAGYNPHATFKTWLYTIAKNCALNELRKNKRHMESLDRPLTVQGEDMYRDQVDPKAVRPDQLLMHRDKEQMVKKAIALLPKNQKTAIVLRKYDHLSYAEIAQIMRTSEKAVKSLLSRGKENLRKSLSKYIESLQ